MHDEMSNQVLKLCQQASAAVDWSRAPDGAVAIHAIKRGGIVFAKWLGKSNEAPQVFFEIGAAPDFGVGEFLVDCTGSDGELCRFHLERSCADDVMGAARLVGAAQ